MPQIRTEFDRIPYVTGKQKKSAEIPRQPEENSRHTRLALSTPQQHSSGSALTPLHFTLWLSQSLVSLFLAHNLCIGKLDAVTLSWGTRPHVCKNRELSGISLPMEKQKGGDRIDRWSEFCEVLTTTGLQ